MTKLNNVKYDKTKKVKILQKKTQIVKEKIKIKIIKLGHNTKTQIVTKLRNSNWKKTLATKIKEKKNIHSKKLFGNNNVTP